MDPQPITETNLSRFSEKKREIQKEGAGGPIKERTGGLVCNELITHHCTPVWRLEDQPRGRLGAGVGRRPAPAA